MDFSFSEEQEMLRTSVRGFVRDRYPPDRVARIADDLGFDPAEWEEVSGIGWTGISVPEDLGGTGLGFFEELILAEELGRGLYPGPFYSCVGLAIPLLKAVDAPELVRALAGGGRIATVGWAGPDGTFGTDPAPKVEWDGAELSAARLFVPDLATADLLVIVGAVPEGTGVWALGRDDPGVSWRQLPTVDRTRRLGEVRIERAAIPLLGILGPEDLGAVRDRALALLAAEAVGVGQAALGMAVEHARTRVQFGKAIGAYQAVSHQLAQAFLEIEVTRSLAYWAGWAVGEGAPEAGVAASAAKSRAGEAAVTACERAIQVHGGVGFTWEHPLHRWYKRALGIEAMFGWGSEHRSRVAAAILD